MTHVTCRLTAKNQDQLWNPMLGSRVWATFTFFNIVIKSEPIIIIKKIIIIIIIVTVIITVSIL